MPCLHAMHSDEPWVAWPLSLVSKGGRGVTAILACLGWPFGQHFSMVPWRYPSFSLANLGMEPLATWFLHSLNRDLFPGIEATQPHLRQNNTPPAHLVVWLGSASYIHTGCREACLVRESRTGKVPRTNGKQSWNCFLLAACLAMFCLPTASASN